MQKVEQSITIERSAQDVWDFMIDESNATVWDPTLLEVRNEAPPAPGVRQHGVSRFMGRRIEWTGEYTQVDPPKHAAVKSETPMNYQEVWYLEPADGATQVTITIEAEAGGFFGKLSEPLLARTMSKQLRTNLETLKEILEAGAEDET